MRRNVDPFMSTEYNETMDGILDGVCAVLFDMDGTLVETNIDFPLMRREMIDLAVRHGLAQSDVDGLDILSIVDLVSQTVMAESGQSAAREVKREAFRKLEEIEMVHSAEAREVPHARELIDRLHAEGIKVGIVTRNSRSAVELSMKRTGISGDVLLTRDDVANTKPHPDHLHLALSELGVDPEHAVMIGDHWMDVQAGKAAGTRTIGFLRPGHPDSFFDLCPPDMQITDLAELLDELNR